LVLLVKTVASVGRRQGWLQWLAPAARHSDAEFPFLSPVFGCFSFPFLFPRLWFGFPPPAGPWRRLRLCPGPCLRTSRCPPWPRTSCCSWTCPSCSSEGCPSPSSTSSFCSEGCPVTPFTHFTIMYLLFTATSFMLPFIGTTITNVANSAQPGSTRDPWRSPFGACSSRGQPVTPGAAIAWSRGKLVTPGANSSP